MIRPERARMTRSTCHFRSGSADVCVVCGEAGKRRREDADMGTQNERSEAGDAGLAKTTNCGRASYHGNDSLRVQCVLAAA